MCQSADHSGGQIPTGPNCMGLVTDKSIGRHNTTSEGLSGGGAGAENIVGGPGKLVRIGV